MHKPQWVLLLDLNLETHILKKMKFPHINSHEKIDKTMRNIWMTVYMKYSNYIKYFNLLQVC